MATNPQKDTPHVLVVAAILVNSHGEILLAKRPPGKSMAGLWEFPGGKVIGNEDLKTALIRELLEELGIALDPETLVHALTLHHDYPDFHLEMPVFLARKWAGTPAPLEDQELAWVAPRELQDYPMPPADLPLTVKIPDILANL